MSKTTRSSNIMLRSVQASCYRYIIYCDSSSNSTTKLSCKHLRYGYDSGIVELLSNVLTNQNASLILASTSLVFAGFLSILLVRGSISRFFACTRAVLSRTRTTFAGFHLVPGLISRVFQII